MATKPKLPRVPEKVEQRHGVELLRKLGAQVYILGTKRRAGDYQGTNQTPGIPDCYAFVPNRARDAWTALWWEVKAADGRLRDEQKVFQECCNVSGTAYVCGPFNALLVWLVDGGYIASNSLPHYRQSA